MNLSLSFMIFLSESWILFSLDSWFLSGITVPSGHPLQHRRCWCCCSVGVGSCLGWCISWCLGWRLGWCLYLGEFIVRYNWVNESSAKIGWMIKSSVVTGWINRPPDPTAFRCSNDMKPTGHGLATCFVEECLLSSHLECPEMEQGWGRGWWSGVVRASIIDSKDQKIWSFNRFGHTFNSGKD